jgi:hypothetical protein
VERCATPGRALTRQSTRVGVEAPGPRRARGEEVNAVETAIWVALVVLVLVILLIGGRAMKTNEREMSRPFQPTYRDDGEPKQRDDGA